MSEADIILVSTHQRPPDLRRCPSFGPRASPGWRRDWVTQTRRAMQHEALRVRLAGLRAAVVCSYDSPAELLLRTARRVHAQTIVITDDRRGFWRDLILGSVARHVLRASEIGVVVVPHETREEVELRAAS